MTTIPDLIEELEMLADSQRLLCLSIDGLSNDKPMIRPGSVVAVRNLADITEDRLARVIDDLKAAETARQQVITNNERT
jgi:hypothetical protein